MRPAPRTAEYGACPSSARSAGGAPVMRRAAPQEPPTCLTIAGSDSGGGAGIQADLKAMEAVGAFGTSAITAVTAQHTQGVDRSFILPLEVIAAQIEAVRSDIALDAVKTGMLATTDIIELVVDEFAGGTTPLIVDPVMVAASGDRLLDESAEAAYAQLIEHATIVTPNADEAAVLVDHPIEDTEDAIAAGETLVDMGADTALVKGGHLSGAHVTDVLVSEDHVREFRRTRIDTAATHGSGCTLASTIAGHVAFGENIETAVGTSLAAIDRAVRHPIDIGEGPGPVQHLATLRNEAQRVSTFESVQATVNALVTADVTNLIPEVGMNVVGVTPFANDVADAVAVDGRITRTSMGARANAGVAFAASSHVARFVLAIREYDPSVRFGINCRFDESIASALDTFEWTIGEYDRNEQPQGSTEGDGSTMGWAAGVVLEGRETAPDAIVDRGAHGKEPILKLLAEDAATLRDRTIALGDAVEESD